MIPSKAERLTGAQAVDSLIDWLKRVDHVHTRHGIVYHSEVVAYLDLLIKTEDEIITMLRKTRSL